MKISTKSRYGLKAMIDIGINNKLSVKAISDRYDISEGYLEQIIALLKHANLLVSTKGAYGGYQLAKDAKDISLGDILRALDDDIRITPCTEQTHDCAHITNCSFKNIWMKVNKGINDIVNKLSLEELIKDYKDNGGII